MTLETLFERAQIWRGGETPPSIKAGVPTGIAEFDALLPGGGWPRGALSEIIAEEGQQALSLLMPVLAHQQIDARWIAFIAPPYLPYAPALATHGLNLAQIMILRLQDGAEKLWALEQCLHGGCAAVLAWFTQVPQQHLRRLQLAAENGDSIACLFYPAGTPDQSTPAALRIAITAFDATRFSIRVLKRRGGWPCGPITVSLHAHEASAANHPSSS
jgi:cell division inhibitor SulA/protein ImuA